MESFFASLKTDPTKTANRRMRCRGGYNRCSGRVPLGLARAGALVSGGTHPFWRNRSMADRSISLPPRA
jgi:hypothetical protein